MPRPQTNIEAEKEKLLKEAEAALERQGGLKITMSEIAARAGMSQSNAYRFFPSKAALLKALIAGWFQAIEAELEIISEKKEDPADQLRQYILCQLQRKRERFDKNPALFRAYLEIAAQNMGLVEQHVQVIHRGMAHLIERLLISKNLTHLDVTKATELAEDITSQFRDPRVIAVRRADCTDERANAAIDFLITGLCRPV